MRKESPILPTNPVITGLLEKEYSRASISVSLKSRILIILEGMKGISTYRISLEHQITRVTVKKWRQRWLENYSKLEAVQKHGIHGNGEPASESQLIKLIKEILSDLPRSGHPTYFTQSEIDQITALASESPEGYGIQLTQWTYGWLAEVAVREKIVDRISPSHLGKILKKRDKAS